MFEQSEQKQRCEMNKKALIFAEIGVRLRESKERILEVQVFWWLIVRLVFLTGKREEEEAAWAWQGIYYLKLTPSLYFIYEINLVKDLNNIFVPTF